VTVWPSSVEELIDVQRALAGESDPPWRYAAETPAGGCFVCFERGLRAPGGEGDRAWAAASLAGSIAIIEGAARASYRAGLLALREGELLERAVRALQRRPEVLLVDATGRDHPRRAGLALHLGAVLGIPTVGVTHRPLLARGDWPVDEIGARSSLLLDEEVVGHWLRTRRGCRPLAVRAAWRTDPETAVEVVLASLGRARAPEPLREARRAARTARAEAR
jgi:deoxyribonuclease V